VAVPAGQTRDGGPDEHHAADGTRMTSAAIFISKASIFLPRYSGVRPTMRPAMNTAMIANMSMP
jgi:hypothetical protein